MFVGSFLGRDWRFFSSSKFLLGISVAWLLMRFLRKNTSFLPERLRKICQNLPRSVAWLPWLGFFVVKIQVSGGAAD